MVRRYLAGGLLVLALVGQRSACADPINFTGITQTDFSAANIQGNTNYNPVLVMSNPLDLGESSFIPANGWVSGWAVNSVQMSYNTSNDTLYVGLNSFKNASSQYAIFGDADGNGNPGGASPQMAAAGGIDSPNMGGDKSVAVAFAAYNSASPNTPGSPMIIAGIPSNKALAGTGTDGFTVAQYNGSSGLLQNSFGSAVGGSVTGNLAFNPSSSHPELEFSISNFSKSGIDPTKGFWIELYAGSGQDVVAGEAGLGWTYVPPEQPQVITPEPATLLVWAGMAGCMAWGMRRRSGRPCPSNAPAPLDRP
jgi:hypothetical protein